MQQKKAKSSGKPGKVIKRPPAGKKPQERPAQPVERRSDAPGQPAEPAFQPGGAMGSTGEAPRSGGMASSLDPGEDKEKRQEWVPGFLF